jgi:subtilisin
MIQWPRIMNFGLAFLMASISSTGSASQTERSRLILESADLLRLAAGVRGSGGHVIRRMDSVRGLVVSLPSVAIEHMKHQFTDLKVSEDIELKLVEPMTKGSSSGPIVQPAQSIPWGIAAIKSREANAINQGAGVKVCVIDTGVDLTHPDLMANIVGGRNYISSRGAVNPAQFNDDNGHGTHVAGIIAALDNGIGTVGVAPQAKIFAVKALNKRGSGFLSDIADGIAECVRVGSHVINMSLGATTDPTKESPLKTAVSQAHQAGVVVVVAAGNEGQNIANTVPAGYPTTIAVAAVDRNLNYPSWSNFGLAGDDFTAPGVSIYSTWKSNGYTTISGTSMAAPHVAGVVALKISAGAASLIARDLGKATLIQGAGLIDALGTVNSH